MTTLNVMLPLQLVFDYGHESYFFLAEVKRVWAGIRLFFCVCIYVCVCVCVCVCVRACDYSVYVLFYSSLE